MANQIPFSAIKAFLVDGKGDQMGSFVPTDADLEAVIAVLRTGLGAKHLADNAVTAPKLANGVLKLLVFTAADASVIPQSVTLTGAKVGDVVVGVINMSDLAASADFESVITIVDKIHQATTDLSTKVCFILLIAKGA